MNNGLIYKFDHYEDDFSDLTFEYGCRTGNSMFCFISPKDFTLEAVCMFCKSQDQRILMLSFASKRMVTFPLNVLVGLIRSRPEAIRSSLRDGLSWTVTPCPYPH